jgi:hypothetical protein
MLMIAIPQVLKPSPHVSEHSEQRCSHTQSTGHGRRLQCSSVGSFTGQGVPPCCAGVMIAIPQVLKPSPHVSEHSEQRCSHTQSTGHGRRLQCSSVGSFTGQGVPPCCAGVMIAIPQVLKPLPHVSEHSEQRCSHTQSTGHWPRLQGIAGESTGHSSPPYCAGVMICMPQDWYPSPHDTEHSEQRSSYTQSTAHEQSSTSTTFLQTGWFVSGSFSMYTLLLLSLSPKSQSHSDHSPYSVVQHLLLPTIPHSGSSSCISSPISLSR